MQYRRAIRHPQPAEREYLAAQSTGTGVHVGKHVPGGWLVDAAMAESPAEEAGIIRGDCITEISKPVHIFVESILLSELSIFVGSAAPNNGRITS